MISAFGPHAISVLRLNRVKSRSPRMLKEGMRANYPKLAVKTILLFSATLCVTYDFNDAIYPFLFIHIPMDFIGMLS
jgi:hypothetical protein